MRLIKLVTTNFKKLGNSTIEFTLGLNVLAGPNARGKSTVLQAIKCALFGVSMVPGKKEHIASWGQDKFSVQLTFAIGADIYQITRTGSTAKLLCTSDNDRVVANGTTPANLAVEDLMGLAAKDYGLFIESAQGESTGILTFGATALNRKVEEFAGVDVIDKVQALAASKAATLLASAEARRVRPEEMEEANAALDAAAEEHKIALAALSTAADALKAHGNYVGPAVVGNPQAMRELQRAEAALWAKVEQAERDVKAAEEKVAECRTRFNATSFQKADELEAQLSTLKQDGLQYAAKVEEIAAFTQRLETGERTVMRLETEVSEAQAGHQTNFEGVDRPSHELAINLLKDQQAVLEADRNQLAVMAAKVAGLKELASGAQCPTCGNVKEDHDPVKLAEELEAAQELWAAQGRVVAATLQAVKDTEAAVAKHGKAELALVRSAGTLAVAQERYQAAKKEYDALVESNPFTPSDAANAAGNVEEARNKYAEVRAALAALTTSNAAYTTAMTELGKAEGALATAKQAHAALEAQYDLIDAPPTDEAIAAVEQAIQAERDAMQAHRLKQVELKAAADTAQTRATACDKAVTDVSARLARLDSYTEMADKDEAAAKKYSRLVQFLRERRQKYLEEVWTVVLGVSSKLVREASFGLIEQILNRNGEFFFVEAGIEAPTVSASGAQKSFIGTALRVGLSRALYGSDGLLAFDEPTEACTEENAAGMAAMLAASAKQVLLITHRENDQSLAANIINVGE